MTDPHDEHDAKAAEVLKEFTDVHRGWCNYCHGEENICEAGIGTTHECCVTQSRAAVAALLREDAKVVKQLEDSFYTADRERTALKAERDQLKELVNYWHKCHDMLAKNGVEQIDTLKAERDTEKKRADDNFQDILDLEKERDQATKERNEAKIALSRAAGYKVDRCACLLDHEDNLLAECNYHRDARDQATVNALERARDACNDLPSGFACRLAIAALIDAEKAK